MTQKFTAEEVREKAHGYSLRGDSRTAAMLDAFADTLSQPADSGRVDARAREMLAREFERGHPATHYPEYARIARKSQDVQTMAAIRAISAALAAQGQGDSGPGFGLTDGDVAALRDAGLKPEEIAGDAVKQQQRVSELVQWFARFLRGSANPKWLTSHAMELAYYIATNAGNRHIDVSEIRQDGFKSGLNVTPAQRSMLESIGVANPAPPASPAGVPDGCIPIHRTLLDKLATDMDSIDMPKIGAAIRRWVANYDARQSAAPSAPEGDGGAE